LNAIVDRIREAHEERSPVRIQGAGTWLDAGRPTSAADTMSLASHRGIVEYVPGDLTLTARAGTPLSDIVEATRQHGQWLPLDPWGGDSGTLGATISTGTAGPHAASMGLPRDVVLGLEFVTGTGTVIRSGGKVVKNVAGFDLTRLLVGSWGTLGVITEATVRLRARPERTMTIAIDVPADSAEMSSLLLALRKLPFTPLVTELVDAHLSGRFGVGSGNVLLCRIGGNPKALQGQLDLLARIGTCREFDDGVWDKVRVVDQGAPAVWRWSNPTTAFSELWSAAASPTLDLASVSVHGNPLRGVVRFIASGDPEPLARAASSFGGTVVIERLPAAAWAESPSVVAADSISRAIREKFDPRGILNPGILGHVTP
jgi:glycolate oxidase FAD binding subunit